MSITIRIPTPLRPYVGGTKEVAADAGSVQNVLSTLAESYPDLKRHLFNDQGKLRSFVNVYLGEEDVRYLQGFDTPVPDGATLSIEDGHGRIIVVSIDKHRDPASSVNHITLDLVGGKSRCHTAGGRSLGERDAHRDHKRDLVILGRRSSN